MSLPTKPLVRGLFGGPSKLGRVTPAARAGPRCRSRRTASLAARSTRSPRPPASPGVVARRPRRHRPRLDAAFGLADRRHGVPMTTCDPARDRRAAPRASPPLTVMQPRRRGCSRPSTSRVRDVLGADLPLVDDRVTVEHLLAHRSGIGDYFDEEVVPEVTDHVLTVPVHTLGHHRGLPPRARRSTRRCASPGSASSYNNCGFVVLAIVAGRVAGRPFEDLLVERVCRPAGMTVHRLPARRTSCPPTSPPATSWTDRARTNVLHLPVVRQRRRGRCTPRRADVAALWRAAVRRPHRARPRSSATCCAPRSDVDVRAPATGSASSSGPSDGVVALTGSDAGVSFRSVHDRRTDVTWTVISNTSEGAWPVARVARRAPARPASVTRRPAPPGRAPAATARGARRRGPRPGRSRVERLVLAAVEDVAQDGPLGHRTELEGHHRVLGAEVVDGQQTPVVAPARRGRAPPGTSWSSTSTSDQPICGICR